MTALQKISQEAKRIYKANPNLSWTDCIKKASLLYSNKKKNAIVKKVKSIPAKAKKVAIRKAKSGAKSIVKKIYESKLLNGTNNITKKKAVKRSTSRSAESEKVRATVKKDGFIMPHGYQVTKGKRMMAGINVNQYLSDLDKTINQLNNYKDYYQEIKSNKYLDKTKKTRDLSIVSKRIIDLKDHIRDLKSIIVKNTRKK